MNNRFLSCLGAMALYGALLSCALAVALAVTAGWWGPAVGRWFVPPESDLPGDAIAILGGDTLRRTAVGVALYEQGVASRLVITGETAENPELDAGETERAQEWAIAQGVPASAITLLTTTSTAEDAEQLARFAADNALRRVTLVTSWYHGRRAACTIARALAREDVAVGFIAVGDSFGPADWWQSEAGVVAVATESLKLAYYAAQHDLPFWDCLDNDANLPGMAALWAAGGALSALIVGGVRHWALRRRVLDVPNHRSSHSAPTPLGGGLGIVGVTLGGILLARLAGVAAPALPGPALAAYVGVGGVIAAMGWIDDTRALPARVRLATHLILGLVMAAAVGVFTQAYVPPLGVLEFGAVLGAALTVFWLVGMVNVFNFMDGIDGIAGAQAAIAGGAWCLLLLVDGQGELALLAGLVVASCLGFLFWNAPPARVFMGDVGSTFLGFTLAALPLLAYQSAANPRLPGAGAFFVAPFVFDGSLTIVRRALMRENILTPHRSHLYQRLVKMGYTHTNVTALYGLLAVASAAAGLAYYGGSEAVATAALLLVAALHVALAVGVTALEAARRRASGGGSGAG